MNARRCIMVASLALVLATLVVSQGGYAKAVDSPRVRLSATGLYADLGSKTVTSGNLMYSPQYPLWSDGAGKKRWIFLPHGKTIDATDPDNWVFPIGTKLWKEFSFEGKRVETRLLEKVKAGEWRYATYAWNSDETDALLVPESGFRNHLEIAPGIRHDIPGVNDCKACHDGSGRDIVLGFNGLQLSSDRDSLAPHAERFVPPMIDLDTLLARGLLAHAPDGLSEKAPRIFAGTPRARAALGYLWANCGGCHNAADPLATVGMVLKYPVIDTTDVANCNLGTVIGHVSKFQIPGLYAGQSDRICAGDPSRSAIVYRMQTRNPFQQMPPLGTKIPDQQAVDLITQWIHEDLGKQAHAGK